MNSRESNSFLRTTLDFNGGFTTEKRLLDRKLQALY